MPTRFPDWSNNPPPDRFARIHPGEIDLLLMDVVMPLMGGGELAQEFRL